MQFTSATDLLKYCEERQMYTVLIEQLNRDLLRANTELQFASNTSLESLLETLAVFIKELMFNRYPDYLNLMYAVDVAENKLKELDDTSPELLIDTIIFLVLKREWQKVKYRKEK